MKMNLTQIQQSVTCIGQHQISADVVIESVVTDSRKVTPGCLFVAIVGDNFDAHDFLDEVIKLGAGAVVVQRLPDSLVTLGTPALVVSDTRRALGEIAHAWRAQFALPMIGVTGSNGKTTVKEMIAAILFAAFSTESTLATQGNLNNDIGVPQTLFRLTSQHHAAVIELGMNHPGEIAQLAAVSAPTVGLVNNAQREHQEFMQSVEAVAKENGAVITCLPKGGVAVFQADDVYTDLWRSYAGSRKTLTFGLAHDASDADVSGAYLETDFGSQLNIFIELDVLPVQLHAFGEHNVLNALAATASCYAIGCSYAAIIEGLQKFQPVSGRLQKKRAQSGAVVIDDTYNANPDSVRAAIHVLAQVSGEKILVLGDMGEVGADGPAYHVEIGAYAKQHGIPVLLTLGQLAQHSSSAFGSGATHFETLELLLQKLDGVLAGATLANSAAAVSVLVKGSRFMKMERVVTHLMNTGK